MKIFYDISLIDSVDSFCSTLGNELIYEKGNNTNLLLPCFNVGFYKNKININSITKAVDICYILFDGIFKCEIELSTYDNFNPEDERTINLDGNKFKYELNFQKSSMGVEGFYIEGTCLRSNSFSYGYYKINAKSMKVILLNESKFLEDYASNYEYKHNALYRTFLLNQNKEYIEQIIKAV